LDSIKNFNAGSEEQKNEILSHLNSGTIWTFFFGHASSQVFDLDGWHVEYMNNKGRTGFLSTLSCNAGAFAEPFDLHGRNESYVLAKDNGFVNTYGSTGSVWSKEPFPYDYMVDGLSDYRIALRARATSCYTVLHVSILLNGFTMLLAIWLASLATQLFLFD
jgi:hypothetical protein